MVSNRTGSSSSNAVYYFGCDFSNCCRRLNCCWRTTFWPPYPVAFPRCPLFIWPTFFISKFIKKKREFSIIPRAPIFLRGFLPLGMGFTKHIPALTISGVFSFDVSPLRKRVRRWGMNYCHKELLRNVFFVNNLY